MALHVTTYAKLQILITLLNIISIQHTLDVDSTIQYSALEWCHECQMLKTEHTYYCIKGKVLQVQILEQECWARPEY